MQKIIYRLQWFNNGASFTRSFDSYEERAAFIPRIAKRDWRGLLNYTVWESTYNITVIER